MGRNLGSGSRPLLDRFMEKFIPEPNSGCWLWLGHVSPQGYGTIARGGKHGGPMQAHCASYELLVGPIPDGLDLDHLCRVRCCVNPNHLEPVTRRVNTLRGIGPELLSARQSAKTHCPQGHPYSGENLVVNSGGRRVCRECSRKRDRDTYWRNKNHVD